MGRYRIVNHHIKRRGRKLHYVRRVPKDIAALTGKEWIEKSLRTSDYAVARRKRDQEDRDNEKRWEKLRRARDLGKTVSARDPRLIALGQYREALARGDLNDPDAVLPEEPYEDDLNELLETIAKSNGLDLSYDRDEREALRLLQESKEGRERLQVYAAALGNPPIDVAGEAYLATTSLRPETKRLYRGIYQHAARELPPPKRIDKEIARKFLQRIATEKSKSRAANYRAAFKGLWDYNKWGEGIWAGVKLTSPKKTVQVEAFDDTELQRLLAPAEPKLRDSILIGMHTGMRESEIASFKYDGEKDQLVIEQSKTEAGVRTIPCPKAKIGRAHV